MEMENKARHEDDEWEMLDHPPKLLSTRIVTNVANRYAQTLISSRMQNVSSKAQEATFSIVTPDQAFISGFTLEINGKSYESVVKEKEEAKKTYDLEVFRGRGAAHVATSARDSNRFTVSVNIDPQSKAAFHLRYEELLVRKNDKYEIVLNMNPGQYVEDFEVVVNINESRPMKFVKVPYLRSGNEVVKDSPDLDPEAGVTSVNENGSAINFKPSISKQKSLSRSLHGKEGNGLVGQFVVQYDVVRDPQGGEILVDESGYFIHFFAPENLPPLHKQVIFILDVSGSMGGRKITQLKEAMNSILGELKPEDTFSIVEFNSDVLVWNVHTVEVTYKEQSRENIFQPIRNPPLPEIQRDNILPPAFKATEENINNAKRIIGQLEAMGGTDIQTALKLGLQIIAKSDKNDSQQPIIVFLTDGEPTVGQTDTNIITSKISELNTDKVPIFSLSFGDGADREFLLKLSLRNQGFTKHIYEAADAAMQLQDFYKEISSPLLSDVNFKYSDEVTNVTRIHFPILFGGGELYTSGLTRNMFKSPPVEGMGCRGPVTFIPVVSKVANSLERLWAYLTIKKLLEQRKIEDDKDLTKEALRLALKYSFVTDVSSLLVVKPDSSSSVDTEDASKPTTTSGNSSYASSPNFSPTSVHPRSLKMMVKKRCIKGASFTKIKNSNDGSNLGVYELRLDIFVENNYAKSKLTAKIRNDNNTRNGFGEFPIRLPDTAFISAAFMEINGQRCQGYIQEDSKAKQTFDKISHLHEPALMIQLKHDSYNTYKVQFYVKPKAEAVITVVYEERLSRNDNKYEIITTLFPEEVNGNIYFQAKIDVPYPLKFVRTTSKNEASIVNINEKVVDVFFKEDLVKIKVISNQDGAQFVIQYDIENDSSNNTILLDDGHYLFPPKSLDMPNQNKIIYFVVDTMNISDKIKESLKAVLGHLQPGDMFSLIHSGTTVTFWDITSNKIVLMGSAISSNDTEIPVPIEASQENIRKAQTIIDNFGTSKESNIELALEVALKNASIRTDQLYKQAIVFFKNTEDSLAIILIRKITALNGGKIPIVSVVQGCLEDTDVFNKICLQNYGFARRIYDFIDIELQFADFNFQLSQALTSNVTFMEVSEIYDLGLPELMPKKYSRYERHRIYAEVRAEMVNRKQMAYLLPYDNKRELLYGFITDKTALVIRKSSKKP
ncbi:inter-alpha-trypsin inhibitor heavy chain H6-like isoform X13 [Sitophilus oryzae]|uniref:Inter-alpha-trypsin inhibitor heavy chain H6-like isoform X13 n=1 Tax=Sitophilus oryzae TaxID=7048 RepID=A0A6J2Y892_SITOR|nr:inter-alpha-trypsin inhibitor heavy chain H6-like isoform X13 [Sitophilus oryzae]